METINFFRQIEQMNITGDFQITVKKGTENNWVVLAWLENEQCTDTAKNSIPPLILRGTAEKLDIEFFEKITMPLETASGLMVNMEGFMVQLEEARKQSAMEREKTDREKKEKEAKDKKYKDAISKAEQLEKEGRYKEAWTAMPKASEYPEYTEQIRKKNEVYEGFFAPSLFSSPENV
ncbi:PRTRC genetic system protein E [Chryseobacterium sp. 52]|uniref:prtrc system protein e n=1 Tax=Chryseobacterium sp. 52 TaxID=2035213 RepID=UPI000C18C0E2|nr:prtrc system protein e [Chryseobacterium sp. 52]PIF45360.1 PRTRC genetic system protein E [Chryseobacterium sp. 52]